MAEIVGTITNLSDFLSKTQVCLSVKPNDPQQQIICLEADRKYSIPAFQREVRWDDNNLKMLLYDLSRSSKFLGNIILTIKSDHTCEIIDGQQRTTVLMLIVSCIKKKFGTKISTPDLCPLRNEGFTGFQTLLEKAFDQEAITSDDWNAILKSDDYHQLPRIQKLWNTISSSELLADRHKAQGLLDNLCKSEFNIIASYSNDVNTSIQYFLDVNLKGIRLDTEDIFKGYLFSQDSRELTRSLWQKNKRDVLRLNGVTQSSEEKRYPLITIIAACIALCTAVWLHGNAVGETPVPAEKTAVSAKKATVVEIETEEKPTLLPEKENGTIPRQEAPQEEQPESEIGPIEMPVAPECQPSTEQIPTKNSVPEQTPPQAPKELQHGDKVYVAGFGWVEYEGPNHCEDGTGIYENGNKIGIMR